MNTGSRPTALKERTGLFTPPGMTSRARANSVSDRDANERGRFRAAFPPRTTVWPYFRPGG